MNEFLRWSPIHMCGIDDGCSFMGNVRCWESYLLLWAHYPIIFTWLNVWRRQWHPTPVLLPGKSHGRRSLVGCGPWGRKGSDMTERLHFHLSLPCIGEGNGNPLQCSCLENPRDGGAWWAAVYGVAESDTTEATEQPQQPQQLNVTIP